MEDVVKLVETLNKGIAADKLLRKIYSEIGPYGNHGQIKEQTLRDLQYYFEFDDSE